MDINEFWEHARVGAELNPLQPWIGPRISGSVPPPAWSFGDTPELADQLADDIVAGRKTATTSLLWEYERDGQPVPEDGSLGIVLDGAGEPRALVLSRNVRVVPFSQVDEAHALGEAGSLGEWRQLHEDFARRSDDGAHPFRPEMPVVLETLEVLYGRERPRPATH